VFLPPDQESDTFFGIKNLVIEYKKESLEIDDELHLNSKFCKNYNLEEPLTEFISKLNQNLLKYKQA
jgi:hypothetical protein